MTFVWFIIGLGILVGGAELLVRGASRLALAFGISPLVVGLTIVAFGTSTPEVAVSVKAPGKAITINAFEQQPYNAQFTYNLGSDGNVTSVDIRDTTVVTADVKDDAITSAKILDAAVTSADIRDTTVNTAELKDAAVRFSFTTARVPLIENIANVSTGRPFASSTVDGIPL